MPRFLIVLDVDSTLIENEVIEMLADAAGSHDEVRDITERAMAGELDFAESLHARVATLEGLPESCFADASARVQVTAGVPEMIAGVHWADGLIAVVSGGFHEILDPLARELGLDHWRANRLQVEDGRLTGRVEGPIVDADAKASALVEWAANAGIPRSQTIAVGDGANDLQMMRAAGLSVAFDAKPRVRAAADVSLSTRDLASVLALAGLRG